MTKSIPQDHQNDKQISAKMRKFFTKFHVASALKAANAYKQKGVSVSQVFQYLVILIFSNRSMYMDMVTGRNAPGFKKDTVYRFMKSLHINWIRFTTILSANIVKTVEPLTGGDRINVFILDDSTAERNRSKKVELLTRIYDHAKHAYLYGFRMLTLGWSDGNTFLPVNSILLSSENSKSRINEANIVDKRTCAYKRRQLSMTKATAAILELLKEAKKAAISASYVLFDSWFTSPSSIHAIKELGYDVIAMVKKSKKMYFRYNGADVPLTEIYKQNKKRRGRSKYLLSVNIEVVKDGQIIPAKVVYVRNRSKRNDYLCLISTDTTLDEEEIIRIYGKRWDIEVFFKVCKSYLRLCKECNSLSFDAMTAHTAVVFARYMMLAVEERHAKDPRTIGELFLFLSDELADVSWIQAFHLILDTFMNTLADKLSLTETTLNQLLEAFISAIPLNIRQRLKTG